MQCVALQMQESVSIHRVRGSGGSMRTLPVKERADAFPVLAVRHLAYNRPCMCHSYARHVAKNIHWPSCIVGQAQAFLGHKVTFENPNKGAQ